MHVVCICFMLVIWLAWIRPRPQTLFPVPEAPDNCENESWNWTPSKLIVVSSFSVGRRTDRGKPRDLGRRFDARVLDNWSEKLRGTSGTAQPHHFIQAEDRGRHRSKQIGPRTRKTSIGSWRSFAGGKLEMRFLWVFCVRGLPQDCWSVSWAVQRSD